jgi:hypothetical protein
MHRPIQPSPATSTTFSCQLSKTLMAAVAVSFEATVRPPIWLKPAVDGDGLVGVLGAPPADPEAIPL